jgi:hypothetical protein
LVSVPLLLIAISLLEPGAVTIRRCVAAGFFVAASLTLCVTTDSRLGPRCERSETIRALQRAESRLTPEVTSLIIAAIARTPSSPAGRTRFSSRSGGWNPAGRTFGAKPNGPGAKREQSNPGRWAGLTGAASVPSCSALASAPYWPAFPAS